MTRIVLAYSGGLETSIAIPWLAEQYRADVIAVTMDLGQGKEVLEEIRDRALASGALRAHVVDVRDAFVRDYLVRGLKAGVLSHEGASMASALAVPLIAQKLVEIAGIEQTRVVAHGDRAGGGAALDLTVRALDPALTVLAPAGEWGMTGAEQLDYAQQRHLTLPAGLTGAFAAKPAGGLHEEPAYVEVSIERGVPIAINAVVMTLIDLVGSLDIIAGPHGAAPSALVILDMAHQALQKSLMAGDAETFAARVAEQYVRILRDGSWFAPMRAALDAYTDAMQQQVGGVVRLKLFKGECAVVDCRLSAAPAVKTIALTKAH
jgi:argininosuccinate synthase